MKPEFCITTWNFSNDYTEADLEKQGLPNDYHCVYILENGRDAYVGETLHPASRASDHTSEHRKQNFKRMHILTADFMQGTYAEHYENLLIRLMKVDGRFNLVNDKKGNAYHYGTMNEFELLFDKLWDLLAAKKLVKTRNLRLILNSNAYKYSPYTKLTEEQSAAVTHIINVLNSGETEPFTKHYVRRSVLITGRAGTGKTVVSTSLFHYLRNDAVYGKMAIALVIANEQMRNIIKDVFAATGEGLRKEDVVSPIELTKRKYDIVICDEVHALRRNENLVMYKRHFVAGNARLGLDGTHDELDWILCQSRFQILFYDKNQCVKRSDIRDDYVRARIHDNKYRGYRPIELKAQMRIRGGEEYIDYIYDLLYQRNPRRRIFDNYDFRLFDSFAAMRQTIIDRDLECGLSKLCGGYAWKWISKDDPSLFDIVIGGVKIRWNRDNKKWIDNLNSRHEMGSIYTLRGVDLNYAGVVIGPDLYLDTKDNRIKVNRKSLFSNDVKRGASDEEVRAYVLNTYAVLLTRAIEGTSMYVCDDALREYLGTYIERARP